MTSQALNTNPRNTQFQTKGILKFTVDNFNEVTRFVWYSAYLKVDFNIKKADGGNYAVGDAVAIAVGGFLLRRGLQLIPMAHS